MREWLSREKLKKAGEILPIGLLLAVFLFFFLRLLLPAVLPFLLGFLLAALLQTPIDFLAKRWRIPRKIASFLLVLTVPAFLLFGFSALFRLLFSELTEFLSSLSADTPELIGQIALFSKKAEAALNRFLSFLAPGAKVFDMETVLKSAALSAIEALTKALPGLLCKSAGALPDFLFFSIAFMLSAFWFSADFHGICRKGAALIPASLKNIPRKPKAEGMKTLFSLLKAYGILFLLTFSELLFGFLLLRIPYALLLALCIALVDILPVLGTGTVLLPWAAVLLLSENTEKGLGLLILYLVITVLRQILEPRLVGREIGLSPLASFAGMYAGWKLAGVWGMLLFPLILAFLFRFSPVFSHAGKREKADA